MGKIHLLWRKIVKKFIRILLFSWILACFSRKWFTLVVTWNRAIFSAILNETYSFLKKYPSICHSTDRCAGIVDKITCILQRFELNIGNIPSHGGLEIKRNPFLLDDTSGPQELVELASTREFRVPKEPASFSLFCIRSAKSIWYPSCCAQRLRESWDHVETAIGGGTRWLIDSLSAWRRGNILLLLVKP